MKTKNESKLSSYVRNKVFFIYTLSVKFDQSVNVTQTESV